MRGWSGERKWEEGNNLKREPKSDNVGRGKFSAVTLLKTTPFFVELSPSPHRV
jgi:hypothetical protein